MTRRALAALAATLVATVLGVAGIAGADTVRISDATNDVTRAESGSFASEPRIDITSVVVQHEARVLEIAVIVNRFTPLDDDAWLESLYLSAFITGTEESEEFFDGIWFWDFEPDGEGGASATLLSFGEDEIIECPTKASASEVRRAYVLTADAACIRDMPRSLRVGVGMSYDRDPWDDNYDEPYDTAPDDDLSAPISSGAATVTRIAGTDRIATSIALSLDRFRDAAAPAAVLVASTASVDAIAAGPLAAHRDAPLLLTGGAALDPRVADELERSVEPGGDVLLIGGTGALAESIAPAVRALGFRPRRLAGVDRFATAVAIAEEIGEYEIVLIADGRSPRAGLIAGAAAAGLGGVVVLSDGDRLPGPTSSFLSSDEHRHVAIGSASTAAAGTESIVAPSAPELSQAVLDRLLPDVTMIAVAGLDGFADALAGAPHIASLGGGLLLTDGAALSAATKAELSQRKDGLREVLLYGGTAALSTPVADAIRAAVR